jgi:hypothetical protein
MTTLFRSILLIFLLIAMPLQASSNKDAGKVEAYAKQDFLGKFGDSYVKGDIAKVERFKSNMGSFFMLLSIDKKPFNHPYQKPDDDPNNHSLYAYGFVEDNGELKQIWEFKDFNTLFYRPQFYINESGMMDADADGKPEFTVAYFGSTNDKAPQQLRILTYFNHLRYKATAYYLAGNRRDKNHIEYDANWIRLPKATQTYVKKLFKTLKPIDFYALDVELKADNLKVDMLKVDASK